MKKLFTLLLCVISAASVMFFVSCKIKSESDLTVILDYNGGTGEPLPEIKGAYGAVINLNDYIPAREDYVFKGWTLNGETVTEIKLDQKNLTLKAEWDYVYELETVLGESDEYALKGIKYEFTKDELVLPEFFENKKITVLKSGALVNAANVKSAVIKDNYSLIEAGALSGLKKLESLTLPFAGTTSENDDIITLFKLSEGNGQTGAQTNIQSGETADETAGTGETSNEFFTVTAKNGNEYLVPASLKTLHIAGGSVVPYDGVKSLKTENFKMQSPDVTEIKNYGFYGNAFIKSIDLSGLINLEKIGDSNFGDCENLKIVNLNGLEKLAVIGAHAFYYYVPGSDKKHEFEKIDLGGLKSLETIGQMSFWYIKIDELDFSQTKIAAFGRQSIFYGDVKSVKLPSSLNLGISEEESDALEKKYGLNYLNNSEFLANCENLENIETDNLSIYVTAENGALYDYDKTVIYKYAAKLTAENYVAPPTLKTIASTAFQGASALKTIDLSGCILNSIGYNAFAGCSAKLTAGFDKYGYYATGGSKISLASGWKGNCTVTYGERYLFFDIKESNISNGKVVANPAYVFDITATYGDDEATISATLNENAIERGENGYSVTLVSGENVITAIASFGDKTSEQKTYTVVLNDAWKVITDFADGQKIVWADGNLTFKVSAVNAANEKQNIDGKVSVHLDCGYQKVFVKPFGGITYEYSGDGLTATVTLDSDTLLMWEYDITKDDTHIKVVVEQADGVTAEKIYESKYYENAPEIKSETPESGNTASGDEWSFNVSCKLENADQKITSIDLLLDVGNGYFSNETLLGKELSADGLSAEIKVNLANLGGTFFFDGDTFKVKVIVTLESGLKAEKVFAATYSE